MIWGGGIYEYSFDKPYEYIAFMSNYGSWNYSVATTPVYIEWDYQSPCFVLEAVDGRESIGLWRNLTCTIYFDASEIKDEEDFMEYGVYFYAYNEAEDNEIELLSDEPVRMISSNAGSYYYEYTLDKPFENIKFLLGDSLDAEIQSEFIAVDWLSCASPCYRMTLDRYIEAADSSASPSITPSASPSITPTASPSITPTASPSQTPTASPSITPTASPSETPAASPGITPSASPNETPTVSPSMAPSASSSISPSITPTASPDAAPLETAAPLPTASETPERKPTQEPSSEPAQTPITEPTVNPTEKPSQEPGPVPASGTNETESMSTIDVSLKNQTGILEQSRLANNLVAVSGSYTPKWVGTEGEYSTVQETVEESPSPSASADAEQNSDAEATPVSTASPTADTIPADEAVPEDDIVVDENIVPAVGIEMISSESGTTPARTAAVMLASSTSDASSVTIYFDASKNTDSGNGWSQTGTVYIYLVGTSISTVPVSMTQSDRINTLNTNQTGTLWEYTVSASDWENCTAVIFSSKGSWTSSGTNYSSQTVDVSVSAAKANGSYPCFMLNGGYDSSANGKKTVDYLGDLGPLSQAGESMYFYDMTGELDAGSIYAVFEGDGILTSVKVDRDTVTGGYTIPADAGSLPYTTVTFYDADDNQIGERYNFFDKAADSEKGFLYDSDNKNTFYYAATEKTDGTVISTWGAKPSTDNASLAGKTLYFSKLYFAAADGGKLQIGDEITVELSPDANDERTLSYTFLSDAAATQQTILTFIASDGTKYHFLWSDLTVNAVTLEDDVANVTDTYHKATTVYFDATMSKLSYTGTDGAKNSGNGIPYAGTENVYYYATKEDGTVAQGLMEKAEHGTWTDVYKVDLDEGYTKIRFAGYSVSNTTAAANGDATAMWDIPVDLVNPCFYADNSDQVIYNGGNRSGYWAEVYTTRDAEKYKSERDSTTRDVVDIKNSTLTRASDVFYVTSTFYDYYTDYELNGSNRDTYDVTNGPSQRNWVTFRQFNQALSDYYEENSVAIPIYTGHFQPSYSNWGTTFATIASTLNLYGYDNYNSFFSTNNSTININGNGTFYDYAAQGLVPSSLDNGKLVVKNGTVAEPHFDIDFLTGNNSKNAVLGEVYENVAFPFTSVDRDGNGVKYWVFDSAKTTLAMRQDPSTNQYFLYDVGNQGWSQNVNSSSTTGGTAGTVSNTYGFFPFNETSTATHANTYNYGFGTKLEFKFRLTSDGTVQDESGNDVPITFNFSGDDDVWVFVDGELALDVGGAHGRVTGTLDFNTKKATVSAVKASAGSSTSGSNVTSTFTLQGANTDEHTLTMFYMERGMWESNMSISFNFPDENQLAVQKVVDESDVNQELFGGIFDGVNIFSYVIRNYATHYAAKEATLGESKAIDFSDDFAGAYATSSNNTFIQVAEWKERQNVVKWRAKYSDASSAYRDSRYGVIPAPGGSVDVSGTKYLQFKYYYVGSSAPALNHMYLRIEDDTGSSVVHSLSGRTYGSATMKANEWSTLTVDLSKFAGTTPLNWTAITSISFGYNYEADIYLDDFIFKSESAITTLTGFITKQYDIPDYGSIAAKGLVYPEGATYSLTTKDGETSNNVIGDDGVFVLADGDTALFRDQFRRGSYIALEEVGDADVFETTWTMYENGEPVTAMVGGSTVLVGDVTDLTNVQRDDFAVYDGRTEVYMTGNDGDGIALNNTGYTSSQRPADPTFVFRSYSQPDSDTGLVKLQVVYTNRVKTGSLTIRKAQAEGSQDLEGEYTFLVTFTNVAGMGLEGETPITKTITLKAGESETITGIPINTRFTIAETIPDKSYLYEVSEANGQEFTYYPETNEVYGSITTENQEFDITFTNMLKPTIDIEFEKIWKGTDGSNLSTDLPETLTIRLQRRVKDSNDAWQDVNAKGSDSPDVLVGTVNYETSWKYSFTDLDKYVDNTASELVEWEYRIVEVEVTVDEDGNTISKVVEGNSLWENFQATYTGPAKISIDGGNTSDGDDVDADESYEYTITNTHLVSLKILKTDMTNNAPLEGVSFLLKEQTTDNTREPYNKIVVTDEYGVAEFSDLPYGTYYLTETETIPGYTLLKEPVVIVLNKETEPFSYTVNGEAVTLEDDTITITIKNSPNLVLPATGGFGAAPITIGGLSLCSIACLMYIYYMRKRRKEESSS